MDGYWNRHGENSRCVFSSQKNGLKMLVPCCSIYVVFICFLLFVYERCMEWLFMSGRNERFRCFGQKYTFLKNTPPPLHLELWISRGKKFALTDQGDEDAEMTLLDAEDSQPSSSASGFRPLEGLLGSSEGQCLRRMAYETRRRFRVRKDWVFFFSSATLFALVFQIPSLKYNCF